MIRENSITAPITNPMKDTLVPLRTNFNANGPVRWRTSVYLNLFHWPMGKNLVIVIIVVINIDAMIVMGFVDTFKHYQSKLCCTVLQSKIDI